MKPTGAWARDRVVSMERNDHRNSHGGGLAEPYAPVGNGAGVHPGRSQSGSALVKRQLLMSKSPRYASA